MSPKTKISFFFGNEIKLPRYVLSIKHIALMYINLLKHSGFFTYHQV